jgi:hypothetical protein
MNMKICSSCSCLARSVLQFFTYGGKPFMTESTNGKPPYDQIANMAFNADNGGHIDTVGAIILGIVLLVVLFAYMRAQGRNRKLIERLARLETLSERSAKT